MPFKSSDPLRRLPYEIWIRAIQFYARDQPEGVLPLLPVSMPWQESLIQAPELWTTIYFDGGHDEKCRAECFFYMSKMLPIEVVLDRNVGSMETVIKYKDRIETLVFQTKSRIGYSSSDIVALSQKLSQCIYPILAHIHIEPPSQEIFLIPQDLIEVCPALVGIYGAYVDQITVPRLPSNITALGILGDGRLCRGVGDQLEVMRIRWAPWGSEPTGRFEYFTVFSTRLRHFELIMPPKPHRGVTEGGLQYFYLFQAFTSTVYYGLHTISLTIKCDDILRFIPCLSACLALRDLRLYLDYDLPTFPWDETPDLSVDVGHIRKFTLSTANASPAMLVNAAAADNLQGAIRWFVRNAALQDLEELRLNHFVESSTDIADSNLFELLGTTKNLKGLHLTGLTLRSSSTDVKKLILNRLQTLVIEHEDDLEYLELPNLSCLECRNAVRSGRFIPKSLPARLRFFKGDSFVLYRWNEYLVTNHADREPFPQLVALELTINNLDPLPRVLTLQPMHQGHHKSLFAPLTLSNLISISFVDRVDIGEFGRGTLHQFMLDILLSPDFCPRLQTIRTVMYPNWALAIAMSYRRNSLKGVTNINSFWLPGYPQPEVLATMTRALDAADDDPRKIISTAVGIDQAIRHCSQVKFLLRKVCPYCIISGYTTCGSSNEPPDDENTTEDAGLTWLLNLRPTHPWSRRLMGCNRDLWTTYLRETTVSSSLRSVGHCNRHDRTNLVHIGPNTLTGVTFHNF